MSLDCNSLSSKDCQKISNIADYLANAMDREDTEQMASFVEDISGFSTEYSRAIVLAFENKFLTDPHIFEDEARGLVSSFFVDMNGLKSRCDGR